MEIESRIRRYVAGRAASISQHEADTLVSCAVARWSKRPSFGHHALNLGAAAILTLLVIAGGIVVQAQLHALQPRVSTSTSGGPLPPIPNEIVNLADPTRAGLIVPFRLRDGKALTPQSQWVVAPGVALTLANASDCSITTIHLVDPVTGKDVRPIVTLPHCHELAIMLPDGTVLLNGTSLPPPPYGPATLGAVRYDWRTGRIVTQYPNLVLSSGGLASNDGRILYTLNLLSADAYLDFTDLLSGTRLAHIRIILPDTGALTGGIALSKDQRTLFVNEGYQLATFDARSGAPGPIVPYAENQTSASSGLGGWLPSIDEAAAKEGFGLNHGITVDPKGRWLAALGYNGDSGLMGIWLVSTSDRLHVVRRFYPSTALRDLAFSRDGSVLYVADGTGLVVMDPQTGRRIKGFNNPAIAGVDGIAGVSGAG